MEFKTPNNNHLLHLHLCLLLFLGLAFSPGYSNEHSHHPTLFAVPDPDPDLAETGEQSVGQNKSQHCAADLQCQCPPSTCDECPLSSEPEAFKQLKTNLGPVFRQRSIELQEKARTVESAINMADQTIDMLRVLKESDSEFNALRESMLNGADQLRDAFRKLEYGMRNVY